MTFVELEITTQSPEGFVIWRFSTTVPFCPLIWIGPEGVKDEDAGRVDGRICTVALADWEGTATLLAVKVTIVLFDTTGAVNKPAEMAPAVAVQITAWFALLATVAANCSSSTISTC